MIGRPSLGCAVLAASALATPALADPVIRPCAERDLIETLAEPWEANTASFAEGGIRLAVIDRGEPAAAAMELLVLSPPRDEAGFRRCQVVEAAPGAGFGTIDFTRRGATYDAARGLIVDMPVQVYDPDGGDFATRQLTLTIRQDTGAVTAELMR